MATIEATRYAGRRVKHVRHDAGTILLTERELKKLLAKAHDAGAGVVGGPKRQAILDAFWDAIPDGTMFIDLSAGMSIEFSVDGRAFTVDTSAGTGLLKEGTPYRRYLADKVVAQVRAAVRQSPAAMVGDERP